MLAAKTDLDSPALKQKRKKKATMVATYNNQLGSKLYYQKLTLLLIKRSSTSLSALLVVVLFESFTIAISLRKQINHGNMYIAGFLYANCIILFLLCIHGQRKLHPVQLFSMHDFVRCCLSEELHNYASSG